MPQTSTNIQYNLVFIDRKSNLTTSNLNNGDVAFCNEDKSITLKYNDQLITMCPPTQQASIPDASTSQKGIVQLSDSTNTTSSTVAATSTAVKAAYDRGSTGITNAATAQSKADSAYTEATKTASTSQAGRVQLSTATNSTSTTLAATASAVKAAYDLAQRAYNNSGNNSMLFSHMGWVQGTTVSVSYHDLPSGGTYFWISLETHKDDYDRGPYWSIAHIECGTEPGGGSLSIYRGISFIYFKIA